MKTILSILALAVTLSLSPLGAMTDASAAEPMVSPAWVKDNIGKSDVVFLDVRDDAAAYEAGHIPGAINTNYSKDGWREKRGDVVGLLPDTATLEALIGGLGIGNDTHVVIAPAGKDATEMGVGTRIYWTFKVLGHDKVSLLNGGMAAYEVMGGPLETGTNAPKVATFTADFQPQLLATADDVRRAVKGGSTALMDHRPPQHFTGAVTPPPVARPGTLPNAANVPAIDMTRNGGGEFMSPKAYQAMYTSTGANPDGDTINFCNTGHWASVGWFVSHELLGNKKAKVYDGSMAEWSREADGEMITRN